MKFTPPPDDRPAARAPRCGHDNTLPFEATTGRRDQGDPRPDQAIRRPGRRRRRRPPRPHRLAFGFLGPNGAGKTTLIRTLLGLTDRSAGTASILGPPPARPAGRALARVGAIIEEPRFHPHLTGRENLTVAAAVRGAEAEARIDPVLERVGLRDRAADRVRTYSMGMRQRLGIARCLLSDPRC